MFTRRTLKTERASIDQTAIDWMLGLYNRALGKAQTDRFMNDARRRTMDRIGRLVQQGETWQRDLVKLSGLPYQNLAAQNNCLMALTRPVTMLAMHGDDANEPHAKFDIGEYLIVIPDKIFYGAGINTIHMIPRRRPKALHRHPHHIVRDDNAPETGKPTDWKCGTCWGMFGGIMGTLQGDFEVVEMLRILAMFVARYNTGHSLAYWDRDKELQSFMTLVEGRML